MGDDTACSNHKRILATTFAKYVLSNLFCRQNLSIDCTVVQVTWATPRKLLSRVKMLFLQRKQRTPSGEGHNPCQCIRTTAISARYRDMHTGH